MRKFSPKNRLTENSGTSHIFNCFDCKMLLLVFDGDKVCYVYTNEGVRLLCTSCDNKRTEYERCSKYRGERRKRKSYKEQAQ